MERNVFNFYFRRKDGVFEWHIGWVWIAILAGLIWLAF